ncbi:NUDIX hydrolase domain-like protein [Baffinella frigidus]|nr:NUDIX hydrolase domain-like protein [Cryptophyta sp. CCMP2293]
MVITSPALVFCLSALSIVRAWAPPAAIPFGRGTFSPGSSLSGRHLQVRPAAISHNNAMPPPLAHRQVASRLRCSAGELTDVAQLALPDAAQLSDTFAYFRDLTIAKVEATSGSVRVAASRAGKVVAAGGALVSGGSDGCAELQGFVAEQGASDSPAALLRFLAMCVEAEARDSCGARSSHFSAAAIHEWPGEAGEKETALLDQGYSRSADGLGRPDLRSRGMERGGGEKGAREMLDAADVNGRTLGQVRREFVEEHSLLIRGLGVMVHNKAGKIFVHRRSATKSQNALKLDMFVGGLPVAGEQVADAAKNEVCEELGFMPAQENFGLMYEVTWIGSRSRVHVSMFRVLAERDDDVNFSDGEVISGEWMSVAALRALLVEKPEDFVPNCLRAWKGTEDRGFVAQFLK